MNPLDKYYKPYGITNPAYAVMRLAGRGIKNRASKYFSGKMIDIGCGDKSKRYLIGEYVADYIGLEHESCQHDKSNVDIFGTAYEIPQKDESFDCVLSTAVLEHLEEPGKALHEAYRLLKPGGYALYTAPFFWHLHEEPRDFYRYTKFGLKFLFKSAGFEIVEITPLSGFWITFGTELSYYINDFGIGPLRYATKFVIAINNLFFPFLNKIDQLLHSSSKKMDMDVFGGGSEKKGKEMKINDKKDNWLVWLRNCEKSK